MFVKKCPTKFRTLKTEKKNNNYKQRVEIGRPTCEGIFTIKDLFPE